MTGNTVAVIILIFIIVIIVSESKIQNLFASIFHGLHGDTSNNTASLAVRIDFAGIVTSDNLSVSRHTVCQFGYIHIDTSILDPVFQLVKCIRNGSTDVVALALYPIQTVAHLIPVAVQLISGCLEGIIDAIALLAKIVGHGVEFVLEIICDLSKIMSHLVQTVDS